MRSSYEWRVCLTFIWDGLRSTCQWHKTDQTKNLDRNLTRFRNKYRLMIVAASKMIWIWVQMHTIVDLISFPSSTWTPKMESGWSRDSRCNLVMSCISKSNIQNVLDLDSSFPCAQSDVVIRWRTLGVLGLGPQSTSLTFHVFHMQWNLPLKRNSEEENVQISCCSTNL